jgi:hypothetical protein
MAKVRMNHLMKALSGSIGGLVFRQMPDGSVLVSVAPNFSNRKFSKGQKEHQQRFRDASAYARGAAKTQPFYAELAKETMRTAYNIALSDWFNPPVIRQVRQEGVRILIEASDNVMVAKVVVTILDEEAKVMEKSEGIRGEGDWWEYVPKTCGKMITAEAWDLAGNVTKFEFETKP